MKISHVSSNTSTSHASTNDAHQSHRTHACNFITGMQCSVIVFQEPYSWLGREGHHLRINTRKFSWDIARYRPCGCCTIAGTLLRQCYLSIARAKTVSVNASRPYHANGSEYHDIGSQFLRNHRFIAVARMGSRWRRHFFGNAAVPSLVPSILIRRLICGLSKIRDKRKCRPTTI